MQSSSRANEATPNDPRGTNNIRKVINDIVTERVPQEHPMERRATPMGMSKNDAREINEILEASPPTTPNGKSANKSGRGGSVTVPTVFWYVCACILFIVAFVALVLSVIFFINDSTTDRALKLFGIIGAAILVLIAFLIVLADCWIDGTRLYLEEAVVYRVFQVKEADEEAMAMDGNRAKEAEGEKYKPQLALLQAQQVEDAPQRRHHHHHHHGQPSMVPAYVYTMVPASLFHGLGHSHGHVHGHNHRHGHSHGAEQSHGASRISRYDTSDGDDSVKRSRSLTTSQHVQSNHSLPHASRRANAISPTSRVPVILTGSTGTGRNRQKIINLNDVTSDYIMPSTQTRKVVHKPTRLVYTKPRIGDVIEGTHLNRSQPVTSTSFDYADLPPNVTEIIHETTVVKAPKSLMPTLRKTLGKPSNELPILPKQ